ncbi:hypothetical protein GPALN_011615 [Globodera pallida]|nr:hypothetical protein GPALN_011615 [Globodera pallida]
MQPTICFIVLTAIVGIEGQLENFEPKKDDKSDAIVEVLDVGRCRNAVKDYCPCGWAMCVRSHGYLCTDKVTKCCPNNYDINCCGNCHFSCHRWGFRESECWYYCYTCAERCKAIKPATVDSLNDCTFKCVDVCEIYVCKNINLIESLGFRCKKKLVAQTPPSRPQSHRFLN